MKYSNNFTRDFKWYLKMRHLFNFDGNPFDKEIIFDLNGVDGKQAFYLLDSTGKLVPTKHPNILKSILKTKGSANLHIQMYSEDRANGLLPLYELKEMCSTFMAPEWFFKAVENSKVNKWQYA